MKPVRQCVLLLLCFAVMAMASSAGAVDYVGSETCGMCHSGPYGDYIESGHPYKLNKVEDGVKPVYPFTELTTPPVGYSWNDVTYVIGGYGWKARFLDLEGYIITGDEVQYNLQDQTWTGYHADEAVGTKQYTCGTCHTTGWQTFEDNGGKRQDDLPGMAGTFAEAGIGCEGCHGPGSDHVTSRDKADIVRDTSSAQCGTCHYRDPGHRIAVSGGLIKHHEQYDEMINSPHRVLECITCHAPHNSTKHAMGGLKEEVTCAGCHSSKTVKVDAMADHSCESCHMPKSSKSAIKTGEINFGPDEDTGYLGDISSHTFRLNTDPDVAMFTEDGAFIALDDDGQAIVKVEFACATCHNGEIATARSADWMYANAAIVHTGGEVLVADLAIPVSVDLHQNFPNPFNPTTNIRYDLNEAGQVRVDVFDIRGAHVKTLVNNYQVPGRHMTLWNGMNENGQSASSGVYIYRLTAGSHVSTQRMTLVH